MASYQSVGNINIIMKFLTGHKAFVSLYTLSHCRLLSLTVIMLCAKTQFPPYTHTHTLPSDQVFPQTLRLSLSSLLTWQCPPSQALLALPGYNCFYSTKSAISKFLNILLYTRFQRGTSSNKTGLPLIIGDQSFKIYEIFRMGGLVVVVLLHGSNDLLI